MRSGRQLPWALMVAELGGLWTGGLIIEGIPSVLARRSAEPGAVL